MAVLGCVYPPVWLDSFFKSLSLSQEGVLLERVASGLCDLFCVWSFLMRTKPIWQEASFDMWFDTSVHSAIGTQRLDVPILTRAPFHSPVVILNSIIQFRRVFLLMMAAGSTRSHPLFMYLVSNCIVHISFDTHLLDSLWILIWTIMC